MQTNLNVRALRPIVVLVVLALLGGLWAALVRIGWRLPQLPVPIAGQHGALMVSGFLGTLVCLERAVALRRHWAYAAPVLTAIGGLALLLGLPFAIGRSLLALGSLGLALVFVFIYRQRSTVDILSMFVGAVMWLVGNMLWLFGSPIYDAVPWWAGFLILTIGGERLELSRVLVLRRNSQLMFSFAAGLFAMGLLVSLLDFDIGLRIAGAGLFALGAWLLRYDVARRTIRQSGLTRFIAACLLPGYVWLMIGGALWSLSGGASTAGFMYDAMLHSLFLGFVFSMIFGHAPIIIPAVTRIDIAYTPLFYGHLALLQLSLAVRVLADLAGAQPVRMWAGMFNVVAVLLFLGVMIPSARRESQK